MHHCASCAKIFRKIIFHDQYDYAAKIDHTINTTFIIICLLEDEIMSKCRPKLCAKSMYKVENCSAVVYFCWRNFVNFVTVKLNLNKKESA